MHEFLMRHAGFAGNGYHLFLVTLQGGLRQSPLPHMKLTPKEIG
jgi:hypothetical protein